MTINELSTIFKGTVTIDHVVHTGPNSIRIDTIYDGQLGKLKDDSILNCSIKCMVNNVGSTARNGIPFLSITIND